ncbi:MAG TPA: hypothetical protein VHM65_02235, partial [Candidatus Lustribacter sp.]|nr:hypothetical protein [Candidatus Lustribacter sp.]
VPTAAGLAGVVVELAYADPGGDPAFAQSDSLFFDDLGAGTPQEWRARLKDRAARGYTWALTTLKNDGTQTTTTPERATQESLFIRPPIAGAPVTPAPVTPAPVTPALVTPALVTPTPVTPGPAPAPAPGPDDGRP